MTEKLEQELVGLKARAYDAWNHIQRGQEVLGTLNRKIAEVGAALEKAKEGQKSEVPPAEG